MLDETSGKAQDGLLYTFRRCPYAMRARVAMAAAGLDPEVREIVLARKPDAFLALSPKGTVPVLTTATGRVLEESLEIISFALKRHDPRGWLREANAHEAEATTLIATSDGPFKHHLDRYKYTTRYDDADRETEYAAACAYLKPLEARLEEHTHLLSDRESLADLAIFPFVRQFANVEPSRFASSFPLLEAWRQRWQTDPLVLSIMAKVPEWKPGNAPSTFRVVFGLA